MKHNPIALIFVSCAGLVAGQTISDPAHIEVYVTPYYNSNGPAIDVGPYSSGLAAKNESEFIATIAKMKKSWQTLNFAEKCTWPRFVSTISVSERSQFTGFIQPSIAAVFLRL